MNDPKMAELVAKIAFIGYPDTLSHTMRVVEMATPQPGEQTHHALSPNDVECVAWLHDVVEDSGIDFEILGENFGPDVIGAIDLLTRRDDESYWDYIHRIEKSESTAGRLAKRVKVFDAKDNLWRSRGQKKRQERYERVIATLEGGVAALEQVQ